MWVLETEVKESLQEQKRKEMNILVAIPFFRWVGGLRLANINYTGTINILAHPTSGEGGPIFDVDDLCL